MEQGAAFALWQSPMETTSYYAAANKAARETLVAAFFCPSRRSPGSDCLTDTVLASGATTNGDCVQGDCVAGVPAGVTPGMLGDYAGCGGAGGIDYDNTVTPAATNKPHPKKGAFVYQGIPGGIGFQHIEDGLSNTIFIGEKHLRPDELRKGNDTSIYNGDNGAAIRYSNSGISKGPADSASGRFGSWHPGVCQFVLGDGSVRALPNSINTTTFTNMGSVADGQVVTFD
jgi:hypothetical protein